MGIRTVLWLAILYSVAGAASHAAADVLYDGTKIDLLEAGVILHDPDGRLTFDDIVATHISDEGDIIAEDAVDTIAQYGGTYWLVAKVSNASSSNATAFSWSGRAIEYVDLWHVTDQGVRQSSAGRLRAPKQDYIPGADEFLEVDLPFGKASFLVARIESYSFDGFHAHLSNLRAFNDAQKTLSLFTALLLGLIVGLGLYHGFLAAAISDRTYALYAAYTLGTVWVWAGQFGLLWFWFGDGHHAQTVAMFATFTASGIGLLFSMAFMGLRSSFPVWHRIGLFLFVMWNVFAVATLSSMDIGLLHRCFEVMLLLTLAHIFVTCFHSWRRGSRNARYYVLSASLFLLALAYWLFESKGLLPDVERWQHVIFAAASFQMITLAASLAARINWLERDVEYAKEADRAKSQFLATMSHEIRTPMNSVLGFAGLLLDSKLSTAQREYAETIKNSGESLLSILNDVLDLTKIESGALELEVTEFSLPEVIDSVVDLMGAHAYGKGIEFAAYTAPEVPNALKGDPGRLRQVLLNLVNNAVKFTDNGGITIEVTAEWQTERACRLKFSVTDTGIGVSKDKIDDLFNRFTQADASTTRKYGGTGLGLAICKQIVELMGGQIDVESETGHGSRFWFVLDFGVVREKDRATLENCRRVCANANVLVVDDSPVNLSIFKLQLQGVHANVTTASSAREALDLVKKAAKKGTSFDVVIIDHMMPEEDGSSLALSIRAALADAAPKLILSSSSGLVTKEESVEFGFDALLPKPVRQEAMYRQIARLLNDQIEAQPVDPPLRDVELAVDSGIRILLAEDNSANQMLFVAMLTRVGHSVDIAANGLEAIEALRKRPYDLVLMDVQMPEMGGMEATQRIRNMSGGVAKVPIIALTANAMKGDRERFIQCGMSDYVAKPVDASLLFEKIDWWTGREPTSPKSDEAPKTVADEAKIADDAGLDDLLRDLEAG